MSTNEEGSQLGPTRGKGGSQRTLVTAGEDAHEPPVAGVDEAGRGPLAGPVVAAAVVLPDPNPVAGLNDSKELSAKRRRGLHDAILEQAWGAGLGWAEADEIDAINVLQATHRAMERAVAALQIPPAGIRIDGNSRPAGLPQAECLVGGDGADSAIAAASILAKVIRDDWMADYGARYPGYGLDRNKGYGTAEHRQAVKRLGPSPIHRRSFTIK